MADDRYPFRVSAKLMRMLMHPCHGHGCILTMRRVLHPRVDPSPSKGSDVC
eukprot:CAMPEP_0170199236 /NCGR_PEP_ID=MMETSP0040_2-20121228/69225_1 /TAXON_ID=641309 /ORGANISM="Lotharella oceanica, Strain CCMP622" /LENGTH=50 /DNA_ID=CAMNT_0010449335 /DNA_START=609 /DNA_END=761 /DNA_ORIENTATION=-